MLSAHARPSCRQPNCYARRTERRVGCQHRSRMKIISNEVNAMPAIAAPVAGLLNLTKLKGIMFDVDGTLVDSDPLHFKAFELMLMQEGFNNGVPITREWYNAHMSGKHNPVLMKELFPAWPLERQIKFAEDKEAMFRDMAGSMLKPMPGLLELFDWMDAQGLKRVAVTNAPKLNAFMMLDALGVRQRFQAVVLGEECTHAKPHPEPYLKGLKILGVNPDEAIVLEDSPSGLAAAVAAGVTAVGVTTGHTATQLHKLGASYAIDDYHQLLALLKDSVGTPVAASVV